MSTPVFMLVLLVININAGVRQASLPFVNVDGVVIADLVKSNFPYSGKC